MKKILIILHLFPLLAFPQQDTVFNSKNEIVRISENGVENLLNVYKTMLINKDGADGWRLQIKFTSKREDILPYQVKFTQLYPDIPAQITFDSPYYKLTVGNFKTKNEALKIKHKISKQFPGAHPISLVIDHELLRQ